MISNERHELLKKLLNFSQPIHEIAVQLSYLNWDYDRVGVEITKKHLEIALQKFLCNELTNSDVEYWANLIEGREDFEFNLNFKQLIENILYELANPILTQPLNIERAKYLLNELSSHKD